MFVSLKPAENEIDVEKALRTPKEVSLEELVLDWKGHEQHICDARYEHEHQDEHIEYGFPFRIWVYYKSVKYSCILGQILLVVI